MVSKCLTIVIPTTRNPVIGTWMMWGKYKIKSYEATQKGKILLASVKEHFKNLFREIVLVLLSSNGKKKSLDLWFFDLEVFTNHKCASMVSRETLT